MPKVVILLLFWAVLVALRNTVYGEVGQWQHWFLIVLGAVVVFVAGRVYEIRKGCRGDSGRCPSIEKGDQ